VPRVRGSKVRIPSRPNLTQRCKRFTTASTSTKVATSPWRYIAEIANANSLHDEITKGLVWKLKIQISRVDFPRKTLRIKVNKKLKTQISHVDFPRKHYRLMLTKNYLLRCWL